MPRLQPLAAAFALSLAGCATATTGTNQTITVTSDPPGAVCRLERDGTVIGVVNPTPGSIMIGRSTRELTARCQLAGYQEGVRTISASFQAMTLGNILLGGVIGVMVDAASGAAAQYEPNLHVVLPPGRFDTTRGRDAWFDQRRLAIAAQFEERIAAVRRGCPVNADAAEAQRCEAAVQALRDQRELELRALERQRQAARAE